MRLSESFNQRVFRPLSMALSNQERNGVVLSPAYPEMLMIVLFHRQAIMVSRTNANHPALAQCSE
jgi:hypothetical protein